MKSISKRMTVTFICSLFVVGGTLWLSADSLAQGKIKTKQKSDKERIAALEEAMGAGKEQAKVIAALQERVAWLEQRNAQLETRSAQAEQRTQQRQQDLTSAHQRDIMSLNQQIMMLDQQVRMRRM